jgi:hypothetical protein
VVCGLLTFRLQLLTLCAVQCSHAAQYQYVNCIWNLVTNSLSAKPTDYCHTEGRGKGEVLKVNREGENKGMDIESHKEKRRERKFFWWKRF